MEERPSLRFLTFPNERAVAEAAGRFILRTADDALQARKRFRCVLAGGRTPISTYTWLARQRTHWQGWELYLGDERCLSPQDPQRNSWMIESVWLRAAEGAAFFPIPAELGPAEAAARYREQIAEALPFDLVLLGMGEDGHTASLFPGQPLEDDLVVPIYRAPKPPPERVSLSYPALRQSHRLLVLITGTHKRKALNAWRRGANLPIAQAVRNRPAWVFLDEAAAGSRARFN